MGGFAVDASLIRKERRDLLPRVDTNPPDDWRGNEDVCAVVFRRTKTSQRLPGATMVLAIGVGHRGR